LHAITEKLVTENMLTAATPGTDSLRQAHDFSQESADIIESGKVMTMATMITKNPVIFTEIFNDRQGAKFLSYAGMNCSRKLAFRKQSQQSFFEPPNHGGAFVKFGVHRIKSVPIQGAAIKRNNLAGEPDTTDPAGNERMTTELASTIQFAPSSTPG
jgi:hypothetical protein